MRLVGKIRFTLLAGLFVALAVRPTFAADEVSALLDEAPANAQVIVVVPNLAALSDKAAALNDELGLAVPQLKDILGELKSTIGVDKGLNDHGGLMIVLTDLATTIQDNGNEPQVLLLVPTNNYDELITELGGVPGKDVTSLTLPKGQAAFAKKSGDYAVLSPQQQLVEGYERSGDGADVIANLGSTAEHLAAADAAVIVDIQSIASTIEPFIDQAAEEMGRELAAAKEMAGGPEAEMMEFGGVMMSMYIDAARAILRDSQAGLASLELQDNGIAVTEALQFKKGSKLGNMFANGAASSEQLGRLPNQPYLMAGAWNARGLALDPLFEAAERLIEAAPEGIMGAMSDSINASFEMVKQVKAGAMVYYPPQQMAMMGGGMMMGVAVMETPDPQAYLQTYQDSIAQLDGKAMDMGMGGQGPGGGDISIMATYKPNVLQIEGVQVDEYQIQYQYPPQMMQQMGPMAPFFMMLGGMGQSGYVAAKGRHVLMTTARDAQLIRQAIASVDAGDGMGTDGAIKQVREDGLPSEATLEAYLSISGVMNMANMFIGMMGGPPLQVPADLPPVSWGASVKDSALVGRAYVPKAVMKFGKNLADQLQAMQGPQGMAGGGGDDGADGPPPAPF